MIKFKPLSPDFELPQYETPGAANVDFRAYFNCEFEGEKLPIKDFNEINNQVSYSLNTSDDFILEPHHRAMIPLGFSCELPVNIVLEILSRSGLALKNGIQVINEPGQVDEDYRGPVQVILYNTTNAPFVIRHKDRICQGGFRKVAKSHSFSIDYVLSNTVRDSGGFGHTGV